VATIYLIRHGQASFGAEDYDALSPLGFEQARVLGESLAARLPRSAALHVFYGSMRRHRETAETCLSAFERAAPTQVHAGFNEFDHEDVLRVHEPRWADRAVMAAELRAAADPHRSFQQRFEAAMLRWIGGQSDADYRESWPAFHARCQAALADVAAAVPRGENALVFTSGGTITALCQALMGLPLEHALRVNWTLANAGVTKLRVGADRVHVMSINEHAHFEGERGALLTFR
jgi:broad specificity phosphatase PhoE